MIVEKIIKIRQKLCEHDMIPIKDWESEYYANNNYKPYKKVFTTLFKCSKCGKLAIEKRELQTWQTEEE